MDLGIAIASMKCAGCVCGGELRVMAHADLITAIHCIDLCRTGMEVVVSNVWALMPSRDRVGRRCWNITSRRLSGAVVA